jgi:hypothetical protein
MMALRWLLGKWVERAGGGCNLPRILRGQDVDKYALGSFKLRTLVLVNGVESLCYIATVLISKFTDITCRARITYKDLRKQLNIMQTQNENK